MDEKLNKAEELYAQAYDPRMLVSKAYYEKALKNGLGEAIEIVTAQLNINEGEAKDILYLAYVYGRKLSYQATLSRAAE